MSPIRVHTSPGKPRKVEIEKMYKFQKRPVVPYLSSPEAPRFPLELSEVALFTPRPRNASHENTQPPPSSRLALGGRGERKF